MGEVQDQFKPQRLKLDGKVIPYEKYITEVKKAVEATKMPSGAKTYCKALVDHASGKINDNLMKNAGELFAQSKDSDTEIKNGIQKYFGEVVGPIWVIGNNAFNDMPNKRDVSVFHPSAENEPLMDYELQIQESSKTKKRGSTTKTACKRVSTSQNKITKINTLLRNKVSAKSGKTTNTVKSKDLLDLIEMRPDVKKFWTGSMQHIVLTILRDNNTALGPIKALEYLSDVGILPSTYFKGQFVTNIINAFESAPSTKAALGLPLARVLSDADIQKLKKLVMDDRQLTERFIDKGTIKTVAKDKEIFILGYIAVAAERKLEKISKDPNLLEFWEIFGDAVAGMVNYVTFEVDSKYFPKWKASGRKELEKVTGYFRSKNTMKTRLAKKGMADGLGFQPEFG